jgi:alpha/beta superfamily hydrolase
MIIEQPLTLPVAGGIQLDARLAVPPDAAGGVALCHPHPLYGGDMENPVVVRAAEVCRDARLATLRFDFRGVGASTGQHDEGRGEVDDLEAALDHLTRILPAGGAVAALGYSFGATIAARMATRRRLAGVALVAPPLAMKALADTDGLADVLGPMLIVAGTADGYCPPEALERLARAVPRATVRTIEGADHFFFGKLFPLGEAVAAWAREIARRESSDG